MVCSTLHELQEALSATTIALEISSRNPRVAALQKRRDRLRAGLEWLLDQRGADRLVTRIDPGVVSLVAELRGHEGQSAEELGQWKTRVEARKPFDASPAAITPVMLFTTAELEDLARRALELDQKAVESAARSTFRRRRP